MPELPEVHTVVMGLVGPLSGRKIERVRIVRPDIVRAGRAELARRLTDRVILRIHREGKRILFELDDGSTLVIHLGMSGRLTLEPPSAPIPPHTHVIIRFRECPMELRFRDPRRFGGVWFFGPAADAAGERLGRLGPDALSVDARTLRPILNRDRQIKALLLDQQRISGLGNIYVDESLFRAGIHPLTPASRLDGSSTARLARSIRQTLRRAIDSGGSTLMDYRQADGSEGGYQRRMLVYGREDQECRRCRTMIRRIVVGGRSTHFCPRCQRVPSANGSKQVSSQPRGIHPA